MVKIAGVVVLFHPGPEVVECIRSYVDTVDVLFVMDNSRPPRPETIDTLKREHIRYVPAEKNEGIATALNRSARLALEYGCTHLFMMDQDSVAGPGLVEGFREYLDRHQHQDVGILAPFSVFRNYGRPVGPEAEEEIEQAITGGTLLDLSVYRSVGPFKDSFFIDAVDFEYSLRLRSRGFRLMQINSLRLHQALGHLEERRILFRRVAVYHHEPVRVYYRVRNSLAVSRMYCSVFPWWCIREALITVNALIKILLFERQKREKLKMAWRGLVHFVRRRGGSYEDANASECTLY